MTKFISSLILLFFTTYSATAQYEITIEAQVVDYITKKPVSYANIGFVGKSVGTVSNDQGNFSFSYDEKEINEQDILRFSILGYRTFELRASQLMDYFGRTSIVYLHPAPVELDVVNLSDEKRNVISIGNNDYNDQLFGYWKDKEGLGGEIATLIKIRHKRTKLLNLSFNVIENMSDSIKVRVNVYKTKNNLPGEKLLKDNLFKVITTKDGGVSIDLEPYNTFVNDDIIVSLELVEVYGDKIGFAISGSPDNGPSYLRYISQDKWDHIKFRGINFALSVSHPIKDGKAEVIERSKPNTISIFWDVSKAANDTDIPELLSLLEEYLVEIGDVTAVVSKFNNTIVDKRTFKVRNGESDTLIDFLKNSNYEGIADYDLLLKENEDEADTFMLFTSGKDPFTELQSDIYKPVFIITSTDDADDIELQKVTKYTDGYFINLNEIKKREALDLLKFEIEDDRIFKVKDFGDDLVEGVVRAETTLLSDVTVSVKNSFVETVTDSTGTFKIKAKEGDVLKFEYLGVVPQEITINSDDKIQVNLEYDGQLLDEVLIETTVETNKEKSVVKDLKKKYETWGFSVGSISAEDIKPNHIYLADVLRGRFAGVTVTGIGPDLKVMVERTRGSINNQSTAIFDIDGMIYTENPIVNVEDIEFLAIVKGVGAINRYGSIGGGGVVVIVTKTAAGTNKTKQPESLKVKGNDYTEILPLISNDETTNPYKGLYDNTDSFEEARDRYRSEKLNRPNDISFILESADYFKKWNNTYYLTILGDIVALAGDNVKALKTLAFKLDEYGDYDQATKIYKKIKNLRPDDAQSYRDLALSLVNSGQYEDAMIIYRNILGDAYPTVNFSSLGTMVSTELKHLLLIHRSKVDFSNIPSDYLSTDLNLDIRIVFEWNDPYADFELQFVNPSNKFFLYNHSKFENKEKILEEIENGFYSDEYIIDDTEMGEWLINLRSSKDRGDTKISDYLKYTVYHNYGTSRETKEIKLINLSKLKQKVTLDALSNSN